MVIGATWWELQPPGVGRQGGGGGRDRDDWGVWVLAQGLWKWSWSGGNS